MTWTSLQKKLAEQYLNTYFRELEIDLSQYGDKYHAYRVPLTDGTTQLCFNINHFSSSGYHSYHYPIQLQQGTLSSAVADVDQLVSLLCDALTTISNPSATQQLLDNIRNSLAQSAYFTEARRSLVHMGTIAGDFIAAEQGLLLGHPFHVTSKTMHGFNNEDLRRYSPELGVAFKLHYFAVTPTLMVERPLQGSELPQDSSAVTAAKALLPSAFQHYTLLPCHPWQANYLLDKSELQPYLRDESILSLGPLGETVWPTSSVRTVFVPNFGLFIKLSLDVRITNFIRNNPPSHLARAMDASDYLCQHQLCDTISGLLVLPELGAQSLAITGLEASFAILYRQGLTPEQTRNTRVVASLVEECPLTGQLPLAEFICKAAADHDTTPNTDFVCSWWSAYVYASLLPALQLFAKSGVSLEAHLQNSLMLFADGWPKTLVVRDMEGASIAPRAEFALAPGSHASYTDSQAWFRFQYYVLVNHVAHVLSAIARHFPVSETHLWQVCAEILRDKHLAITLQPYCQQLLQATHLPAKGNLLSTLKGCGEAPVWVSIPNPLSLPHDVSISPNAWQRSESRVQIQLLEALCYEQVLSLDWHGKIAHIRITPTLAYQFKADYTAHFNRLRIEPNSVIRLAEHHYQQSSLTTLLKDLGLLQLTDQHAWLNFSDELYQTTAKHAQILAAEAHCLLRDLPYAELEAKVNNGHLYHPSFKSRLGFTLADNAQFGPELASPFTLQWLAVSKSQARFNALVEYEDGTLLLQSFTSAQQRELSTELVELGLSLDTVYLVPVHPWQWQHIGALYFTRVPGVYALKCCGPHYLPQQSIRTLSHADLPQRLSVKLALSITNTSTSRVLAPHTVANASAISDWLGQCVADNSAWHQVCKPLLLREVAGLSIVGQNLLPAEYGALACIWRESIESKLSAMQRAVPATSLTQLDRDGQPLIAPWIAKHGLNHWLQELIDVAFIPVMHLLWYHGLAMESHAQNMVLILENNLPVKVALKDFHDGVRYNPAWLANPDLLPQLTDAPAAHAAVNPNSFLVTTAADELRDFTQDALCFVNLGELGWFFEQHFGLSGQEFWQSVVKRVMYYQAQHPELKTRFALFDFFAPQIAVEQLASRRFLPEQRLRVMVVDNPLHIAQQQMALSMDKNSQKKVSI